MKNPFHGGSIMRMAGASSMMILLAGIEVLGSWAEAIGQVKKSDAVVKVTAKGGKVDSEGKQVITITLKIDKGWHIYANPVGEEAFKAAQTVVTLTGKKGLQKSKIVYPAGKIIKDKIVGDYAIYEGTVHIKAEIQREKGDTGALECAVKVFALKPTIMLLPAIVKVPVE